MRKLQVAIVGDPKEEFLKAAEKTGLACARRGFVILALSDKTGESAKLGAQMVNSTVVVFDGGKKSEDQITVRCSDKTDALLRAINSSDGVIVVGDGDSSNLAYMLALNQNKPVAVVHSADDAMAAVAKILELAVSGNI